MVGSLMITRGSGASLGVGVAGGNVEKSFEGRPSFGVVFLAPLFAVICKLSGGVDNLVADVDQLEIGHLDTSGGRESLASFDLLH